MVVSPNPKSFQAQWQGLLSEESRRTWSSLSREADPELFYTDLLHFAAAQKPGLATAIYQDVLTSLPAAPAKLSPEAQSSLLQKAKLSLDALAGHGSIGARGEILLRNFFHQALHPASLAGMAGAQLVFSATRMFLLSRLAASPVSALTRGTSARVLASAGAFMVEAPSFTAFTRLANAGLGQKQDWSPTTISQEVAASYLSLGAMKLGGAAAAVVHRRLGLVSPLVQTTFQQGGMLGGILLGHEAEIRAGLRERADGTTTFLDSLAMLAQFNVSGRVLHAALPRLTVLNQEWRARVEAESRPGELRPRSLFQASPRLAALVGGLAYFLKTAPAHAATEASVGSSIFSNPSLLLGAAVFGGALAFLNRVRLSPRPYQVEMLESLRTDLLSGEHPWLGLASPMQTGKSTMARYIIPMAEEIYGKDTQFLVLSSSRIITTQLVKDLLGERSSAEVGRLDGLVKDPKRLTVASIFTLQHPEQLAAFSRGSGKLVILIDEAFHTQAPIVRRILGHFQIGEESGRKLIPKSSPNTVLIGFSGTGSSLEGYRLSGHLDLLRALEEGWVRPMRGERISPAMETLEINGSREKMIWWKANTANAVALAKIYGEKIHSSFHKSLLYVPTIAHGELLKAAIEQETGKEIRFVHSKLEPEQIENGLETWQSEGGPLISVKMLSHGFRAGEVGAVFHTYQSSSAELFAQRTGRAWGVPEQGKGEPLYVLEATWDQERFSNLATLLGLADYPRDRLETGANLFARVRRLRERQQSEAQIQTEISLGRVNPAFSKVPALKSWREAFQAILAEAGGIEALSNTSNLSLGLLRGFALGILPSSKEQILALQKSTNGNGNLLAQWVEAWREVAKEVSLGERRPPNSVWQKLEFWRQESGELETQAQSLSTALSQIFSIPKNHGLELARNSLELQGDFVRIGTKRWTQADIDAVLRAIVAQDRYLYPEGSAEGMTAGPRFFTDRWYRVGSEDLTLHTLSSRERQMRSLKSDDTQALSRMRIVRDWKHRIWGIESAGVVRDSLKLQGAFIRADKKRWSQAEIDAVLRAIVAQDRDLYPEASAEGMTTNPRFFRKRWYRVGGEDLTLSTLAGRERLARGLKADNHQTLIDTEILRDWKRRIWGIESRVMRDSLELQGEFIRADQKRWSQAEIDAVLRAIVAQDRDLYPEASAEGMTTGRRFFTDRWYRIGSEDLTLSTLACRERQARGLKTSDSQALSYAEILRDWKRRVWGIESAQVVRDSLELQGEFIRADQKRWNQAEIDAVLRAIVAQDRDLYPEASAKGMNGGLKFFYNRWYRVGGEDLTLHTLAGRERQTRSLKSDDTQALSNAKIFRDWKRRIWGIESAEVARDSLELQGEFIRADRKRWSQAEIDAVLRAIVAQDRDLYPEASAEGMTTNPRFFRKRWYRVEGEDLTLSTLAGRERRARGLKADDRQTLTNTEILRDWKRRVWGI